MSKTSRRHCNAQGAIHSLMHAQNRTCPVKINRANRERGSGNKARPSMLRRQLFQDVAFHFSSDLAKSSVRLCLNIEDAPFYNYRLLELLGSFCPDLFVLDPAGMTHVVGRPVERDLPTMRCLPVSFPAVLRKTTKTTNTR